MPKRYRNRKRLSFRKFTLASKRIRETAAFLLGKAREPAKEHVQKLLGQDRL